MSIKSPFPPPPGQQRSLPKPTTTGKIPFTYDPTGLKAETTFFLWGSLSSSTTPLIALHGGPGMAHNYILPICHIYPDYDIPVLMYDQVGCGQSTHFPEKNGDESFWPPELFIAELENVIAHFGIQEYDLLGQSWGGMLAGQFAISQPKGLRKLIIEGGPDDIPKYVEAGQNHISNMPPEVQEVIQRCERDGTTDSEEYKNAELHYYSLHICRVVPFPKEMMDSFTQTEEDPTVYNTMFGPNEFQATGSLKTWSIRDQLHKITAKTVPGGLLLMNGRYDSVPAMATEGFFSQPTCKIKWIQYGLSSHTPMLEETEKFVEDLGRFLTKE